MKLFPQTQETIQNATEVAKDSINLSLAVSAAALVVAVIALVVVAVRTK